MTTEKLSLSHFEYELPGELIAQKPADPRDHSRLLVYERATGRLTDDHFYNLATWLPANTLLVLNNSRVEKARLLFKNREVFVTRVIDPFTVEAMVRPGRLFRLGRRLELGGIGAEVLSIQQDGQRIVRFDKALDEACFEPFRRTPFPPYIAADETLSERYQTIYACAEGSKAAPTAGLHFTQRVFSSLEEKGIARAEVTLHVGLGTFGPVKADDIHDHIMHSEWYQVTETTARALQQAAHLTAVGTTSARVLESLARTGSFRECEAETDIFITPGHTFGAVDAMVTNFHLPGSTLLMMIAAFTGLDEMHRIYRHAIAEKYRFYSFGDAMLLL